MYCGASLRKTLYSFHLEHRKMQILRVKKGDTEPLPEPSPNWEVHTYLLQEAQLPQRNSASVAHLEGGN